MLADLRLAPRVRRAAGRRAARQPRRRARRSPAGPRRDAHDRRRQVVGPARGTLVVDDGLDRGVRRVECTVDIDAGGGWIVPGFIDVQINGAHGIDVTTQPHRIDELAAFLPRYGVTAFLPTVITCPPEVRAAALAAFAERSGTATGGGAARAAPRRPDAGAGPQGRPPGGTPCRPGRDVIAGWSPDAGVALATLAPELPGASRSSPPSATRGVVGVDRPHRLHRVRVRRGRAAGARYVTHLFNAMRPFAHRDPGPIGAALADDEVVVGLICDGIHVDPVAVRMAWRALGPHRLSLVTDAVAALGTPRGRLGAVDVTVGGGGVRNASGVLAGSVLSLDQAVRNLVAFTGLRGARRRGHRDVDTRRLARAADRGRLARGARADVTVLDPDLRVVATIVGGEVAWRS